MGDKGKVGGNGAGEIGEELDAVDLVVFGIDGDKDFLSGAGGDVAGAGDKNEFGEIGGGTSAEVLGGEADEDGAN